MDIITEKYKLRVRQSVADDFRFCHRLARRNMEPYVKRYWGGWDSKRYHDDFKRQNIKVVLLNGRRIGFCSYKKREDLIFIVDMQLSTNFRGKGIGQRLLEMIEKEARRKDLKKIGLEVFKDNPARKLYEAAGFREIKDKKHSLEMEKKIK